MQCSIKSGGLQVKPKSAAPGENPLVCFVPIMYKWRHMARQKPPARRPKKGSDRYTRYVVAGIVLSLAVIALVLWGPLEKLRTLGGRDQAPRAKKEGPAIGKPAEQARKEGRGTGEKTVFVALVIDDLGPDP